MIALIAGGTASGKSEIAEGLAVAANQGKMAYIATLAASDGECERRIAKHRRMRAGKGFETLEAPFNLCGYIHRLDGYDTALLECVSNLLANEMYLAGRGAMDAVKEISAGLNMLCAGVRNVIIVSNTYYSSTRGYDGFSESYIRALGELNCIIAGFADAVMESVCSVPVIYKWEKEMAAYENLF